MATVAAARADDIANDTAAAAARALITAFAVIPEAEKLKPAAATETAVRTLADAVDTARPPTCTAKDDAARELDFANEAPEAACRTAVLTPARACDIANDEADRATCHIAAIDPRAAAFEIAPEATVMTAAAIDRDIAVDRAAAAWKTCPPGSAFAHAIAVERMAAETVEADAPRAEDEAPDLTLAAAAGVAEALAEEDAVNRPPGAVRPRKATTLAAEAAAARQAADTVEVDDPRAVDEAPAVNAAATAATPSSRASLAAIERPAAPMLPLGPRRALAAIAAFPEPVTESVAPPTASEAENDIAEAVVIVKTAATG